MPIILQYLLSGVGLLVALAYGFGQWKQGRNQNTLDSANIYKERIEALELKAKSQDEDIINLTAEVHKLRKENEEANRKLMEAMQILQGMNPEMSNFLKSAQAYILLSSPIMDRMNKFLDKQRF